MKPTQSPAGIRKLAAFVFATISFLGIASAPAQDAQPLQPGAENIQGIVVLPKLDDVNTAGISGVKGVDVRGPEFLKRPAFAKLLQPYLGTPLTEASLANMQTNIIRYCRERGHLVVDVFYREQDIVEGTIQIAVIEGKIGKIAVKNEGKKWFSDALILRNVTLKEGDPVIASTLNQDLSWLGRNTYQSLGSFDGAFRDVTASFKQGQLGETDLQFEVKDRPPVRLFAGVENTGILVIGETRFFAGANFANLFGVDQRANYQYVADVDFAYLKEHVASYTIPLPWKHEFTMFGAYAESRPDFSKLGSGFQGLENDGKFIQASARYSIPLRPIKKFEQELSLGFDYKNTDSPLFWGLSGAFKTNKVAVLQFSAAYSGREKDKWGGTSLGLQVFYSPGGMTPLNGQDDFTEFQPGSDPNYVYGRGEIRRETLLPYKFSWMLRAAGQASDAKLIATEQLNIGGFETVRGYEERIVSGDYGWLLINELRTPRITLGNLLRREDTFDWIQFHVFLDYGGVINRDLQPGEYYNQVLLSAGFGLRYQMAENLRVRFDYGWQLDREYAALAPPSVEVPRSRAHFGVEVSF